jgi:hypothetical protein
MQWQPKPKELEGKKGWKRKPRSARDAKKKSQWWSFIKIREGLMEEMCGVELVNHGPNIDGLKNIVILTKSVGVNNKELLKGFASIARN